MKSQCLSMDRISSLPENLIETILCLVPIRDAVRTSILSRKWRYNWVKIPKLVFVENDMLVQSCEKFEEPPCQRKHLTNSCKVSYAIIQVLLQHEGPIHEFTLTMDSEDTCVEFDQIIIHLSRYDTLKKFTLTLPRPYRSDDSHMYRLPLSFFSLHQLTDLCLKKCDLDFKPTNSGFSNLTSLFLEGVRTSKRILVHLLSSCPLVKRLSLIIWHQDITLDDGVTFLDLFNCLPMIEHLSATRAIIKSFAENGVPRELPTALVHLKYLYIDEMMFGDTNLLHILGLLMRSSPNLETIRLHIFEDGSEINSVTLEEYLDITLEHLNELEILDFAISKPELEFVKLILAKSPVLKKVSILLGLWVSDSEQLNMVKILLRSPRSSLLVDINVDSPYN